MAEISYPFAADSATGGTKMVSQAQWQEMSLMWGGDRIDFQLTSDSYDSGALPFSSKVLTGRVVELQPGRAWVGGFYYQLSASATVNIEANPTDKARKDTIVLRADLAAGSVNLKAVKGQPAASPIAPQPQRLAGQVWEMVLYEVDVPAYDGAISTSLRASFDQPSHVTTAWNTRLTADFLPKGTFLLDMDNNGGDTQYEAFKGRDGYVMTRHFGKSRTYTPKLVNMTGLPSSIKYTGRWRYISPNTVFFSVWIENPSETDLSTTNAAPLGVTLPTPANGVTGQVLRGIMRNPTYRMNYPNLIDLVAFATTGSGATYLSLYSPNRTNIGEGLDNHKVLPAGSSFQVSGVYEANLFSE